MPDHRSITPMNATEFSKILLVQALEESDPHGHHLPLSTRHHATQQAREQHRPSTDHSYDGFWIIQIAWCIGPGSPIYTEEHDHAHEANQ